MSRVPYARSATGFTLVEMLIVIAIIGILTAMLMPTVMDALESGRAADCSNNLHQIGIALQNMQTRSGMPRVIPKEADEYFNLILLPEVGGDEKALSCPTNLDEPRSQTSYGFHVRLHRWGPEDTKAVLAMDFGNRLINPFVHEDDSSEERRDGRFEETPDVDDPEYGLLRPRHRGFCNIMFGDTHVDRVDADTVLYPEIYTDEITPGQIAKLEKEYGETIDVDSLSSEQIESLDSIIFRERWVYLRDEHYLDENDKWMGAELPAYVEIDDFDQSEE